ncbi:PLP-dependent aminotransferase family protein [Embleya sp. NBC_00896]|uniref:aminotransferase-like domain-containing protein n=1 Tax=Embleya sp. NBC_00896 TaxID=2975961 RepID=UPI002F907F90|nr:PLP-dependent aminotransferase family protein [Embleya sp. NBC_00896]
MEVDDLVGLLGDWTSGEGALYRRLATATTRLIADGALPAGTRLPAERRLAKALAVSRATVVSAYDALRAAALAESRRGSGTSVARRPDLPDAAGDGRVRGGQATALLQRMVSGPGDVISLGHAVDGGGPDLASALLDLVREDLPDLLRDAGYHPAGLPALRAAIAAHHTDHGLPTEPDQVLVTTGATQAIALATRLFVRRGAAVVIESPSWPGCIDAFRAAGARLVAVGLDDEGVRVDLLARAFVEHRPALLFVMPTYHNPTGSLMSESRRRRVAALAGEYGVTVMEDSAHAAATAPGEVPAPIAAHASGGRVLTVGSLSKAVWSGLRIGWVRAPRATIEPLARLKAGSDLSTPLLDQALAARLLPGLPALSVERRALMRHRLTTFERLLAERLPDWRPHPPAGGSVLWVELPPDTDARVYAQVALRHGVEVVPGAAMDATGAHDHFLRVPFAFDDEVLRRIADRLAAAWVESAGN